MRKKQVFTDWVGIPQGFRPEAYAGFVYLVENTCTHQLYVGRKYFWAKTRKKVKGRKRRKVCVKESDWRTYRSSSDELKKDIEKYGIENFCFTILSLHKTRAQVNYEETRQQFIRDVLYSKLSTGLYEYYNNQILNRYYRRKDS